MILLCTGSDPIQEALREYDLKRHNNLVPPDIFMGLRFADQENQTGDARNSADPVRFTYFQIFKYLQIY